MGTRISRCIAALTFVATLVVTATAGAAVVKVPFMTDRDGSRQLWTMKPSGGAQAVVGSGFADAYVGQINPAGTRVAFGRYTSGGTDLYTAGTAGGGLKRWTKTPAFSEWHPTWSPDGKQLAYVALDFFDTFEGRLIVRPADGSQGKKIVTVDTHDTYIYATDWSPNGRWIAMCQSGTDPAEDGVFVVRPNGDNFHVLIPRPGEYCQGLSWSPDGKHIVFSSGDSGLAHLFVAKADGTGVTDISQPGTGHWPVWPTAGTILFTDYDGGDDEIFRIDPDGANRLAVTDNASQDQTGFFT